MSKKRDISDLRDHLFDAIERLKNGDMDVKQAIAVAQLGGVLVQSVKVEVEAVKVMGGRGSGFVELPAGVPREAQQDRLLPELTPLDAGAELPDIAQRYGKVGDKYYGMVENQRGQRKLVDIPWRSLKEKIGPLEMVPVYQDLDQMEQRLIPV